MSNTDNDIRIFLAHLIDRQIINNDTLFESAKKDYIDTYKGGHVRELILFDEDYYISQRGSRIPKGMTPVRDFFENGVKLRLSPHPIFDMTYIDNINRSGGIYSSKKSALTPDVNAHPINPFSFILCDEHSSAAPNMLFSPEIYKKCAQDHTDIMKYNNDYADIDSVNPIIHYLKNWSLLFEKGVLRMSNYFDPEFYSMIAQRSSDSIVDPMTHYFRSSILDRHDCNPKFHGKFYKINHNVQTVDALSHFIRFGAKKGFAPNPYAFDELGITRSILPEDVMEDILLSYVRLNLN